MATKLRHTITFPFGMAAYVAAVSDTEYWKALSVGSPEAPGELESTDITDTGAEVHLIQRIPGDKLPPAVTALVSGDLAVKRSVIMAFLADDHTTGSFDADVTGTPATTKGTIDATGADECTVVFTGSVNVRIPLVGGKIEKMIAENLVGLFDAERDFTIAWHDEHS
ncbi:DUF2505 domain-containing protein [Williamsia maris]|uniref:DUF2505 domain-containing protein n=1 Tax=Williamsia maris TaxID=72806 RepID=A0ABT1HAI8_9NOCA|nr:DUF2505 domain-containing protein [Williamsia maris]MCP2175257.1 Protein of unknown function (DUF2505) [Williamsia maris]